jgi:CCR4-NOT transcriptional regulation complex NOT5 subunit
VYHSFSFRDGKNNRLMGLRLSQLENKPEHRLKAMMKKHWGRIGNLESIIRNSKTFNIPLSPITENAIQDKIKYYQKELFKISDVWNWKYNDKYKGGLGRWARK